MTSARCLHHIRKFNSHIEGKFLTDGNNQDASHSQDITQGNVLLVTGELELPISYEEAFAGTSVPEELLNLMAFGTKLHYS